MVKSGPGPLNKPPPRTMCNSLSLVCLLVMTTFLNLPDCPALTYRNLPFISWGFLLARIQYSW